MALFAIKNSISFTTTQQFLFIRRSWMLSCWAISFRVNKTSILSLHARANALSCIIYSKAHNLQQFLVCISLNPQIEKKQASISLFIFFRFHLSIYNVPHLPSIPIIWQDCKTYICTRYLIVVVLVWNVLLSWQYIPASMQNTFRRGFSSLYLDDQVEGKLKHRESVL